ncbi:hypothetical protein [Natrinema sp. SYSU A 869]|uniref:hypothetical protein n=1 Tax=Natrinema sp. SYSU A 869 TaxID=2871694 RepID=UPI001CA45F93|nr:hypothetical protein [Natrinema sp. SYSU A 869]
MDEIGYIDTAPYFANGNGNPINIDHILNRIYKLLSDYGYAKESTEFIYYLDRIAEDMTISEESRIGPTPTYSLPHKLAVDLNNNTDFLDDDYRFYIFYILCRLHQELDDYEGMRKLVNRYEQEFQGHPYYGKLKSFSLVNSTNPETLSKALDEAFDNSRDNPDYPDLHKILAEVIMILIEKEAQYVGSNTDIPKDDQELLEIGKREINRAVESGDYSAEYLSVKAQIESLNGEHDAAKASISHAISELSRSRTNYTNLSAKFGRIETHIEIRQQQSRLEDRTDEISSSVTKSETQVEEAKKRIKELNSEIDTIHQDFSECFRVSWVFLSNYRSHRDNRSNSDQSC